MVHGKHSLDIKFKSLNKEWRSWEESAVFVIIKKYTYVSDHMFNTFASTALKSFFISTDFLFFFLSYFLSMSYDEQNRIKKNQRFCFTNFIIKYSSSYSSFLFYYFSFSFPWMDCITGLLLIVLTYTPSGYETYIYDVCTNCIIYCAEVNK